MGTRLRRWCFVEWKAISLSPYGRRYDSIFVVNLYAKSELKMILILKPEPGPSPTFIFEARFWLESQIYRVSQDMRNRRMSKNVAYGYSCKCTVLSHLDQNNGLNKQKFSLLVNDNAAECNVSQERMKLSRNYPRWR